ncbi:hypothetical protein DFQ26_004637 [Actinomortierella ambigua]|nr:hypothetical protein DFQ26_004637 [Actinomortierella ambigua]
MAGADFVQHLRKLPENPDDSGYEYLVFGNTAAEMFSEYPGKVHNDHLYIFSATFDKCEPSRAFAQGEPKRGPHTEIASRKSAYDLSLQVKFDHSLAKMYKPLPYGSHD